MNNFAALKCHLESESDFVKQSHDPIITGISFKYYRKKTSAWENLYTDWIDLSPSRNMVVHFELLGRDLERILREILSFLGLEVDDRRLNVITFDSSFRYTANYCITM